MCPTFLNGFAGARATKTIRKFTSETGLSVATKRADRPFISLFPGFEDDWSVHARVITSSAEPS